MPKYNGHPSWNAWNVSLWIGNDEGLYRQAVECIHRAKGQNRRNYIAVATTCFLQWTGLLGTRTPDGAVYNRFSVQRAIAGLAEGL